MRRSFLIGFLVLIAIGLATLYASAFTVYQTQQALILRFGEPQRIITEPGLHWKVPLADRVVLIDKRILALDSPAQEVIASDQKRLVVDAFARYRITDALKFFQAAGSIEVADSRLASFLNSAVRRVLGDASFVAVVRDQRQQLMNQITDQTNRQAQSLGITVIDVRIRRADLPQANSEAIFRRMQTERQQEAAQIRAEGEEEARRVRSRADRDATVIVAEANRESEQVRGDGDAERSAIFADAYGKDRDFFAFYRSMLAYDEALTKQDTRFVLSPDSEFFRYFGSAQGSADPGDGTRAPDGGAATSTPAQ
ncbi:protease modulator HflC [Microbaculum sp. FT89]|uniref:protease modulator HflC n=1 Tax=Microbaculum sp. FT89 TaxID=3447298 RepID=UPI003F530071